MREPLIIENGRNLDLRSKLLLEDTIFLDQEFTPELASLVIQQLLYLDSQTSKKPVKLYIMSPGGCIKSGLAIYDVIKTMRREVSTVAVGMAASMGAFTLICCGAKGKRYATRNAQILIHQASTAIGYTHVDEVQVRAKLVHDLNQKLFTHMADAMGTTKEKLIKLATRDWWIEGEELVKLGIVDKIL